MRAAAAAPATEAVRQRGIAKCHYNWALSGVSSSINPATRTHAVWNIWQNFGKKENSAKACRCSQADMSCMLTRCGSAAAPNPYVAPPSTHTRHRSPAKWAVPNSSGVSSAETFRLRVIRTGRDGGRPSNPASRRFGSSAVMRVQARL